MKDLIIIAGAPGSGKTTVGKILAKELDSFVVDFGHLREIHLHDDWSNQSEDEEQMSFENLVFVIQSYKKHGYKNVILTDLRDARVQQIPDVFADFDFIIFSLVVSDDAVLQQRIEGERDSGYKNVEAAQVWNRSLMERSAAKNEFKIDNTGNNPRAAANQILEMLR